MTPGFHKKIVDGNRRAAKAVESILNGDEFIVDPVDSDIDPLVNEQSNRKKQRHRKASRWNPAAQPVVTTEEDDMVAARHEFLQNVVWGKK